MKTKRILLLTSIFILIVLIGGAFFYIRSPFMSNRLKRVILPELSRISGHRITSERVYINPIPFFVGFDNLLISDTDGKKTLSIKKARLYIKLLGLLRRELNISVASIDGLQYDTTMQSIKDMAGLTALKDSGNKPSDWRVRVGNILLKDGNIRLSGPQRGLSASLNNIRAEVNLKRRLLNLKDSEAIIIKKGSDIISGNLDLLVLFHDDEITVKALRFKSGDSQLKLNGTFSNNTFKGSVKTTVSVNTLSEIFSLKSDNTGSIGARGKVLLKIPSQLKSPVELLRGLSLDVKVKGSIYLETLMELLRQKEPLKGLAYFSGTVKGPIINPVAQLRARMKKGHLYGNDVDSVECRISYKDREMRFYDGRVNLYNGKAAVEVRINLPRVTWYSLKVKAESLDSPDLLKLIRWDPGLPPGSVSGFLESEGHTFQPTGTFRYHSTPYNKKPVITARLSSLLRKVKTVNGSFSMKDRVVTLTDLKISSDSTVITSGGDVDLKKRTLRLKAVLSTEDLAEIYEEGLMRGTGQFKGKITGSIDDPVISGDASLCRLFYMNRPLGCLDTGISYRKHGLTIKYLEGRLKETTYSLRGEISTVETELFDFSAPVLSLQGNVSQLHLDDLKEWIELKAIFPESPAVSDIADEMKGILSGDFRLQGPINDLSSAGHIDVDELKINGDYNLRTDFKYRDGRVYLSNFILRRGSSFVEGELSISREGDIKSKDLTLSLLSDDFPPKLPYRFRLHGTLKIGGSLRSPEGELTGEVEMLSIKGLSSAKGRIDSKIGDIRLRFKDHKVSLAGELFRKRVSVAGEMETSGELPWKVGIEIKEGRYEEIVLSFLKEVPKDLFLSLKGGVTLSGTSHSATGSVLLKSLKFTLYDQNFTNTEDILLAIEDSRIEFRSFSLRTGLATLNINGNLDLETGYDLSIDGVAYLDPLKGFISGLEYIKGRADFVFGLKGQWTEPVISGGLTVEETSISIKGFPNRLHSVNGYMYIDENSIILNNLSGRFASGKIMMSGVGQLKDWKIMNYHLEGLVKDININVQEGVSFRLSGNLVLTKKKETLSLIGDLRVLKGRYTRTIEWKSWILSSKRAAPKKKQPDFLGSVELNINLYGDEDIIIDNNLARAPAKIDLVVLGTLSDPALIGRVELLGGKIFFRNNEFSIINASADFTDPARTNPFFDIVAQTKVKNYRIHLSLEGYIDQFSLSLSSEPPLDETDILSLLTVGELGAKLKGLEGGIGASEAASFLTGEIQGAIEERLRNITGFDRIEVEPYVSEATGTVGPRVTVSKRLLSDRMYVTYTTSIGDTPEYFLRLEFFLSDRIYLVGERDELGTIGADIKFRLEFR